MELRQLRQLNPLRPATWSRVLFSLRDLAKGSSENISGPPIELLYRPSSQAARLSRRLRVLFAAPKFDYGDPRRGLGIEENYFLNTLVAMGHEVVRFDSLGLLRRRGKRIANELLAATVEKYRPDLMFAVLFKTEFDPSVLDQIRSDLDGRTIAWFCDDQWRFEPFSRIWAPHFGLAVTTSPKALRLYHDAGINNVLLSQWACNHFLYRPLPLPKKCDVSFVGQPHGDRPEVVQRLRRAGIDIQTWGFGWPNGRVTQDEFIQIISESRINLNLSNASVGAIEQLKGRDFEVPGCRAFLITKRTDDLDRYYDVGREVEAYDSVEDLVLKIRHYLAAPEERERISEAGYRRTLAEHTMEKRLTEIFENVMDASKSS